MQRMFFFGKNNDKDLNSSDIEQAYLLIAKEDLSSAKECFLKTDSPRARWGISLINILNGYIEDYPTYFEIRNFLEIDLDFLIKNEKIGYIEQLLGATNLFIAINPETYKYIARVMFENCLYNVSKEYLEKSKAVYYKDPELHFMFTKYYIKVKDFNSALSHIEECLKILPEYYPAKILKQQLLQYFT